MKAMSDLQQDVKKIVRVIFSIITVSVISVLARREPIIAILIVAVIIIVAAVSSSINTPEEDNDDAPTTLNLNQRKPTKKD
jgi:hypothetical protein